MPVLTPLIRTRSLHSHKRPSTHIPMRWIYRGTGVVIGQFDYAFDFSGLHVFTDFAETVVQHF